MIFREKMILTFVALLILAVFIEALPIIYPEFDIMHDHDDSKKDSNVNDPTKVIGDPKAPLSLSVNDWGKDIFYDRSNIYNSWFKLTGITQFEDGYKAIINGEIVHELNQVRGFKVKEITENRVILERNQYSVTLKLEK